MSLVDAKNIPKVAWAVARTHITRVNIPLKVSHYITYKCNLKCRYCGRISVRSPELKTEEIKTCMREFRSMGTEFWGLSGGEPLMRKDLGELIAYAKALGIRVSVSTNGFFVPQRIDELRSIDLAIISLDGKRAVHDEIRGAGSYDDALRATEVLRSHGREILFFCVLTNRMDEEAIREIVRLSNFYGAKCEFQPLVIHRSDLRKNAEALRPETLARLMAVIQQHKKDGAPIANSFEMLELLLKYPEFPAQPCWAKRLFCAISPDGRVLPCSEMLEHESRYLKGHEVGWKKAFQALPDMRGCRDCFFSCYSEYNLVLNRPVQSAVKVLNNMLIKRRWLWE